MSKELKTISYSNFINILSDMNHAHMNMRMGQMFSILFIKGENPDMFYATDGVDAQTMISDWMVDNQISYSGIPVPAKNMKSIKSTGGDFYEIVKKYLN